MKNHFEDLEPKTKSTILVRPCYDENGDVSTSGRFIGMIYVYGKKVYESVDCDSEGGAFNNCAKHIQWYQNKYKSNFFIDAKMDRLQSGKPKQPEKAVRA